MSDAAITVEALPATPEQQERREASLRVCVWDCVLAEILHRLFEETDVRHRYYRRPV